VAEAMRMLEQSEIGELTDDEMRTRFKVLKKRRIGYPSIPDHFAKAK